MFILLFLAFLYFIGFPVGVAWLIAYLVKKKLIKTGNPRARMFSVLAFVAGFIILFGVAYLIAYYNFRIER
ncbi:MAG: hypothetical protein ABJA76_13555 [Mucilaginibacter sp.]